MRKLMPVLAVTLIVAAGCAPLGEPAATSLPPTSVPATAFPSPTPTYGVEVTQDVEYVKLLEPDAPVLKLDVYAPAEPGPWPVVVIMHYGFQNKDGPIYRGFAKDLAGRGVVVFVPQRRSQVATVTDYAANNGVIIRETQESWACSVRFARERAADYGGDPEHVTVFGDGGGALDTAFIGDDLQPLWEELASQRGAPPPQTECLAGEGSARVDAHIACGGDRKVYEILKDSDPDLWGMTSPFALIGRNPGLEVHLVHGESGNPTNIERAREYQEALVGAGYNASLTLMPGGRTEIPWSGANRELLIQVILEAARR
jgi:hypothetical protein